MDRESCITFDNSRFLFELELFEQKEIPEIKQLPFPQLLQFYKNQNKLSYEKLACDSNIEISRIKRLFSGVICKISLEEIIALSIAMHLMPEITYLLLTKNHMTLDESTKRDKALIIIIRSMYL